MDAAWHILNALAAPVWVALLSVVGVKLLWRRASAHRSWKDLAFWAGGGALVAHLGAWHLMGAEGTMAGYLALVAAVATALWVRVFAMPRS